MAANVKQRLTEAYDLISLVKGPLSLVIVSGRGLRKSELQHWLQLLKEAQEILGDIANEN